MENFLPDTQILGISSALFPGISDEIAISKIKNSQHSLRTDLMLEEGIVHSIKEMGLLQPILVRISEDGNFEVVAGNRRLNACRALKWKKIACHIVEMDDKEAFEVSLVENIQRKSLSPLEEARAFKAYVLDFGWGGISELARRVGKSISYVAKRIKMLELPEDVQNSIRDHTLSASAAEELISISDPDKQSMLAELIRKKHLTSKEARESARGIQSENDKVFNPDNTFIEDIEGSDPGGAERARKSFDKSITALRIAMNRISIIMEGNKDLWILYEVLNQHRYMLHSQIDFLIKEKKKLRKGLHPTY